MGSGFIPWRKGVRLSNRGLHLPGGGKGERTIPLCRMIWMMLIMGVSFLSFAPTLPAQPGKDYTGRKISLDFHDSDVRNILKLIAEGSGLNIVAGDEVKGRVTIRVVEVPWDQALDVVLQSQSLGRVRVGNVIRIAPLERLRREREAELFSERAKEKLEDVRTAMIHLKHANARDMVPVVRQCLGDRGTVSVEEGTNTLIMRDISKNIEEIRRLFREFCSGRPAAIRGNSQR
jgi:type IV pilus assembly protein PilQ